MAANQNERFVIKSFCWLKSGNMFNFLKNICTRRLNMVCHNKSESKRQPMEWKYTNSPTKKKFRAQGSVKKLFLKKVSFT